MDPKYKSIIDERIEFIKNLEFSEKTPQRLGVWLFKTPDMVIHEPYERRDRGNLLLGIINNNAMTTLYWKHKYEGDYDYSISFDELTKFVNSGYYDAQTNPISIANIKKWTQNKDNPNIEKDTYKKIKLVDGVIVRYYSKSNKFETIDGKEIKLDDIFEKLPEDIQTAVMDSL
jgi:hypothetical protein